MQHGPVGCGTIAQVIDLLIRGGTVIDGTGAPGRRADVAVHDGRIVAVGERAGDVRATRVIDADGLVVAPGFIDMHSHADYTLPANPGALNSLAQGVTTEVIGNCGFTPAPLGADAALADETRLAGRGLGPTLAWDWRSFGDYLARLDAARPSVNCIALVGHGTIRLAVMGAEDRGGDRGRARCDADPDRRGTGDGAWGMSTGLVYPPGHSLRPTRSWPSASPSATSTVCTSATSGTRTTGSPAPCERRSRSADAWPSGSQVSHLKAAGLRNHGRSTEALGLLAEARASGVSVTQDVYPYAAASTLLSQLVPPWVHAGGSDALVERLRAPVGPDPDRGRDPRRPPGLAELRDVVRRLGPDHGRGGGRPGLRRFEGLTLEEAARTRGKEPLDFMLDLLIADRASTTMIITMMDEADVRRDPGRPVLGDRLGPVRRRRPLVARPSACLRIVRPCPRRGGARDLRRSTCRPRSTA